METEVHVHALAVAASVLLSFFPVPGRYAVSVPIRAALARRGTGYLFCPDGFLSGRARQLHSIEPPGYGRVPGTVSDHVHPATAGYRERSVRAARSGAESRLGCSREPHVCEKPARQPRAHLHLRRAGFSVVRLPRSTGRPWPTCSEPARACRRGWLLFFKLAAVPISILALFFIYWLLPNRQIAWRRVVPVAILVGLALEVLKYLNLVTWPLLKAGSS